ncbi:ABC transporter permease [Mycoplasma sp. Mirounga ES2805-ORL]|uniref:ABC transporter permease n=1 Tax=Mycoplasma sp. Mirounga ES2805-ORL TaxID=754514 RepID=UPI00197B7CE3|nr:ABC transporter permease [Mycoplasma sp. Mirounga ES2805-ORL]QSF13627.1 ABC transporter permease [Mycoplasma sp. Mirounga ES2805-ORL]
MSRNDSISNTKLSKEMHEMLVFSKRENHSNNIAGKPKVLVLEIFKRFITNPVVIISFIIFVLILLTAIIVKSTSPYPSVGAFDSNLPEGEGFSEKEFIPPLFNKWTETSDTNQIKNIIQMKNGKYKEYLAQFANYEFLNSNGTLIRFNYYDYFNGNIIFTKLRKAEAEHITIDQALVDSYIAALPTLKTYFGTNGQGVDVWTASWVGTFESIKLALIVATIEAFIGISIGSYLGFHAGKRIDTIMMRVIEIFQAPPSIIWLLMFVSLWGTSNNVLILGLLFSGWTWPIGTSRMFIITVKDEEYIVAAKSIGASTFRQVFLHALPAIIGKLVMNFVRRIPSIILSVASLAFLGFFETTTTANLGSFIFKNLDSSDKNIWQLLLPTTILLGISLSLQFVAIGLHDALDPRVIKGKN